MTENLSHDEDLTLEESDSEAVTGGKSSDAGSWVAEACTTEGTEYRNSVTGKTKLIKSGPRR